MTKTNISYTYYLFSFNGNLYLNEIANYRTTWVQLTEDPDSTLGAHFPCEAPRRRARRDWGQVISPNLEGALSKFDRLGVIHEARQYLIDLVRGLEDGWDNELITNFDQSGFEVNDFIPFSRIPANRQAFQAALHARAELVGELDELLEDYPLAEDWLELIGSDTISDIRLELDNLEINLFEDSELTVTEAIRDFQRYGSDTDYSQWAADYLDNSGEADYDSREHYRDCVELFEAGVQVIERSIIETRVSLREISSESYPLAA
jgi:hypothetical protein